MYVSAWNQTIFLPSLSESSGGFTYHQNTPVVSKEAIDVVSNETVGVRLNHKLSSYAARALTKAHGILMIIAWPIVAGTAIYYPAYLKVVLSKKGEWFHVSWHAWSVCSGRSRLDRSVEVHTNTFQ